MQQTLLALCGLLIFSIYALGRHQADARVERDAVAGEVELMVTEQARALLTRIVALPYDEADVGATVPRVNTTGLSVRLGRDSLESTPAAYDDVDDWNGFTNPALLATWDGGTGATHTLTASVVVRYVNPTNPTATAASPTLAKEVVVTVREAQPPAGRPAATATLRQVVTPALR